MRERDIQAAIIGHARAKRCMAQKLSFGEGWPDYMLLHNGCVMFMEFKGSHGHLRPLQEYVISLLRDAGFDVHVVKDVEAGKHLVDLFVLKGAQPVNSMVDYSDIIKQTVEKFT